MAMVPDHPADDTVGGLLPIGLILESPYLSDAAQRGDWDAILWALDKKMEHAQAHKGQASGWTETQSRALTLRCVARANRAVVEINEHFRATLHAVRELLGGRADRPRRCEFCDVRPPAKEIALPHVWDSPVPAEKEKQVPAAICAGCMESLNAYAATPAIHATDRIYAAMADLRRAQQFTPNDDNVQARLKELRKLMAQLELPEESAESGVHRCVVGSQLDRIKTDLCKRFAALPDFTYSPLLAAVEEGCLDELVYHLALGELSETSCTRDCEQRTLLHRAVLNHRYDAAGILLDHRVDINARDGMGPPQAPFDGWTYRGCTPLAYAVLADDRHMIRLLLDRGADAQADVHVYEVTRNVVPITDTSYVYREYHREALIDECSHQANMPLLILAAKKGYIDTVRRLLSLSGAKADDEAVKAALRRAAAWSGSRPPAC